MQVPSGLIFLEMKQTHRCFHLAVRHGQQLRTSCGMIMSASSEKPVQESSLPLEGLECCSGCSAKASAFSKNHFNGRPLGFKKKTKSAVASRPDDEMMSLFSGNRNSDQPPPPGCLF